MIGDFSEVVGSSEKKGGNVHFTNTGFGNCICKNGLIDLGFIGSAFTWLRNSNSISTRKVRLDRGVGNVCWRQVFPKAFISHPARVGLDHATILLFLVSN